MRILIPDTKLISERLSALRIYLLCLLCLIISCLPLWASAAHGGSLSSVTPSGASSLVTIYINGTGFNTTAGNNEVVFTYTSGGTITVVPTVVTTIDSTIGLRRLTVKVPESTPIGRAALRVRNKVSGEISKGISVEILEISLSAVTSAPVGTTNLNVRIIGSANCQFIAGKTRAAFGTGVTVNSTTVESLTSLTANITVSPTAAIGSRSIGVVTNTQTAIRPGAFTITSAITNNAPVILPVGNPLIDEGTSLDVTVSATDTDGDLISLTTSTLPGFAGFTDHGNGAGTLTLSPGYTNAGSYNLTFTATDSKGASASAGMVVTVRDINRSPSLDPIGNQTVREGDLQSFRVDGSDPDGDALGFTVGNLPPGAGFDPGTRTFNYTPGFDVSGRTADSFFDVFFEISDGRGGTANETVQIMVQNVNQPPVAYAGLDQTAFVTDSVSLDGRGSSDPDGDFLTYHWSLQAFPPGSAPSLSDANAPLTSFTADLPGTYVVQLIVGDGTLNSPIATAVLKIGKPFALARTATMDGIGHPLGDVDILEEGPAGLRHYHIDSNPGYITLGQGPGKHLWKFSRSGYLPVWRQENLVPQQVGLIASPWLAARAASAITISPLQEGEVADSEGSILVTFPAGVFSENATATLTTLTGQNLPGLLPLGWSPLQAFWLELLVEPSASANATVSASGLAPAEGAAWVRWNEATFLWEVVQLVSNTGGLTLDVVIPGSGAYALVVGDTGPTAPSAATSGEALRGATLSFPNVINLTASGTVVPPVSPASTVAEQVTAQADVVFAGAEPLPSGMALRGEVEEFYSLNDGSTRTTPRYEIFFVGYQRPGDNDPMTLQVRFPMRPQLLLGPQELMQASVIVDVMPVSVSGANVLDEAGGEVVRNGVRISAAPGDLAGPHAVDVVRLDPARFADLVPPGGTLVLAFRLDVDGVVSGHRLQIGFDPQEPDAFFVLARVASGSGYYGLDPVERFTSDANGNLVSAEPPAGERLPGVTGAGYYLLVRVDGPLGLVAGIARNAQGQAAAGLVVRIVGQPWLTFSAVDGRFRLIVPVGDFTVSALDLASGDASTTAAPHPDPSAVAIIDVTLTATGPRVVSVNPADGATGVNTVTAITIVFSEPVGPGSFGADGLRLRDAQGNPVTGALTLNLARTVATLLPTNPLANGETHTIEVSAQVQDTTGLLLEGPRMFSFTTKFASVRNAGAQMISYAPGSQTADCADVPGFDFNDGTVSCVLGTQGTADPDVAVILINEMTGETATVRSKPDGSFKTFLRAEADDFMTATFVNANGTRIRVPLSRQLFDDGSVGLFPSGGVIEAEGEGGSVQVIVEPDTIQTKNTFKLNPLTMSEVLTAVDNTQPEIGQILGGFEVQVQGDRMKMEGEINVTFPLDPAVLNLPPGVAPEDGAFALAVAQKIDGQTVYQVIDKLRFENGHLQTNTLPFLGVLVLAGAAFDALDIFKLLLVPVFIGHFPVTVTGTVYECPAAVDDGECHNFTGTSGGGTAVAIPRPLNGAFVALRLAGGRQAGRLEPGMVYATSGPNGAGQQGRYALVAPTLLKGYILQATHPRFANAVSKPVFGALDFGITLGAIGKDLFFLTLLESRVNAPPRVNVAHTPYYPVPGEAATVVINASHAAGMPIVAVTVKRVVDLADNSDLPLTDVKLENRQQDTSVPNSVRVTYTAKSDKMVVATLLVQASSPGGTSSPIDVIHAIVFGGAPSPGQNVLALPDPNDDIGPRILFSEPGQHSRGFGPGDAIRLTFNEPIDKGILDNPQEIALAGPGAGSAQLDLSGDQQALTINPGLLQPDSEYTLTVNSGITDLNGNAFDQDPRENGDQSYTLTFRTAPTVVTDLPGVDMGGGAALHNGYAFVLDRGGEGSLRVYDISDPTDPKLKTTVPLPGPPRDLVVIPDYSFKLRKDGPAITHDLLAVTGGELGSSSIDPDGNVFFEGQYLRIFDISNPAAPSRVAFAPITLRPSAVVKLKWRPPYLAYFENGSDIQQIGVITLQTFILGYNLTAAETASGSGVPLFGVRGIDANSDGDFVDDGDQLPTPARSTEFFGKEFACTVNDTTQRIIDFDFYPGYCGVTLTAGKELDENGRPVFALPPSYRTLEFNGIIDRTKGRVRFSDAARPKRLTTLFGAQIEINGQTDSRVIALVSLSPDGDGVNKLAVIDITLPESPVRLSLIPFPDTLGLSVLQSVFERPDGLLALATTTDIVLLDPGKLALPNPPADGLHPSIAGIISGAGSGNMSLGMNTAGLSAVALGGRNEIVQKAPRLTFISFPGRDHVVNPQELIDHDDKIEEALALIQPAPALFPARLREDGGAISSLSPPSPASHYHVLLDVPGGAGPTIELGLESLNAAGYPIQQCGRGFPPVHALTQPTLKALKQEPGHIEAPVRPLTAYRLSDDKQSPYYNVYLSRPFALTYERISKDMLTQLKGELDREILWSGHALRAFIDPVESANNVVGPFAAEVETSEKVIRPGVGTVALTLPASYVMGPNPPPVGGHIEAPGTFGTVSANNGEFRHETMDIALPSPRLEIAFERTIGGQDLYDGPFGRGWDFNYNQRLVPLDPGVFPTGSKMPLVGRGLPEDSVIAGARDVLFHDGSGRVVQFKFAGETAPPEVAQDPLVNDLDWTTTVSAFYLPEKGVFDVLVRFSSGQFARLTPDGMQFWYTKRGRLERIYDRYPDNRHDLIYNERDELIRIGDASVDGARFLDIGYYRFNSDPLMDSNLDEDTDSACVAGNIARLKDYAGRDILFFYTGDGLLERREGVEVSGANGGFSGRAKTTYLWSPNGDIQGVVAGGGSQGGPLFAAMLGGSGDQPVVKQGQVPGGSVTVTPPGQNTAAASDGSTTSVTGPDGAQTKFTFDKLGNPKEIKFGPAATYTPKYNDLGLLESLTFPEGNSITYTYDVANPNLRSRANVTGVEKRPGPRGGSTLTAAFAYDGHYNLLSGRSTDFNGNLIPYTLTGDGRDIATVGFGSAAMSITYNANGQVESQTTPDGLSLEFSYDTATGFKTAERHGGIETRFGYDGSVAGKLGMPTSVTLPRGAGITNDYDARLQLTKMTRGGLIEIRAYDENGNMIKIDETTGGANRVEERHYNQINFLEEVKLLGVEVDGSAATLITKYTPDAAGRVKEITYPGNETETIEYDDRGHVTKRTRGQYVEEYTPDLHGNLTELKQGGDVTRTYVYDGHDRLVELHKKAGSGEEVTTFRYFGNGELASLVVDDPQFGQVRGIEVKGVDEIGRPKNVIYNGDTVSSFANHTYSSGNGGTISIQGPRDTTVKTYDAAGRLTLVSDSLRRVTYQLDDNGNIEAIDSNEDHTTYHTTFKYDNLDWTTEQSDDVGLIAKLMPRIDGSPVSITDGLGHTTGQGFTVLGELASIDRPSGVKFEFHYSDQRDPSAVLDGTDAGHKYAYDDTFRMTSASLRNGSTFKYSGFDGRNQPTSITIPGGSITAGYDLQGRLISQDVSSSGPGFSSTYTYDAVERVREATYNGNTATYTYDQLGPLLEAKYEENGSTFTVGYHLYPDGARKQVTYPSVQVAEDREGNGRLMKVSTSGGAVIELNTFAGAEIPIEVILGGTIRETNTYDLRKRLLATRYEDSASGALLADMRYQYDAADNLIARQFVHRSGRADLFAYDAGNRLAHAEVGALPAASGVPAPSGFNPPVPGFVAGLYGRGYTYDGGGLDLLQGITTSNWLGFPLPPFAASISGHDGFLYPQMIGTFSRGASDPLGNTARTLLYVRDPGGAEPREVAATLTYDGLSQLRKIERDDGVTLDYQYQHNGLVHRRTVRQGGNITADEAFVYDAGRLIEIYDLVGGSGQPLARFYYADGDAPEVAELRGSGGGLERFYYLRDAAGSVVAVADAAANVVERVIYDPWGQPVIERRDSAAPHVARVISTNGGLFVQFTEIVLPPLANVGAGTGFVTSYVSVANAITVTDGGTPVFGTITYEEHPTFGTGLRFQPGQLLSGALMVTLNSGSMADEWGNGNPAQTLSFTYSPIEGAALFEVQPLISTAPERSARSRVESPFLFHGQYFDYDAGLVYLRARFYDPFTGHFLQRDPDEYEDSVNLYAGFAQNPVTYRDPSGRGIIADLLNRLLGKETRQVAKGVSRAAGSTGKVAGRRGLTIINTAGNVWQSRISKGVAEAVRKRSGAAAKAGQHVEDVAKTSGKGATTAADEVTEILDPKTLKNRAEGEFDIPKGYEYKGSIEFREFRPEDITEEALEKGGYKLHISADELSANRVAETVLPILLKENIHSKIAANLNFYKGFEGKAAAGKLITIYTRSSKEAADIVKKLEARLLPQMQAGVIRPGTRPINRVKGGAGEPEFLFGESGFISGSLRDSYKK